MKRFLLYILTFLFSPFVLMAQGVDRRCWMAGLDDARTVASLSIPGAHDAATGEGLVAVAGLGKCQELSLAELWDCGVRAFDMRPAVDGGQLHIYHGIARTKISFGKALEVLCRKLEENPGEFAIVLLREEVESESDAERALWPVKVGAAIAALGEKSALFSPAMSVGEARGKIIFLSRSAYTGCDRGALVSGWSHAVHGNESGAVVSCASGEAARLQVQDYYALTTRKKQQAKRKTVLGYLRLAAEAPAGVWTINCVSGYCNRLLGITPFATTAGYKRNAQRLHPQVMEALEERPQSAGIVMMDFAGCDKVRGGIFHWDAFETGGAALVEKIIELNF